MSNDSNPLVSRWRGAGRGVCSGLELRGVPGEVALSVNVMQMMHLLVITSVRVLDSNFHARKLLSSRYLRFLLPPSISLAILDV